MESATTVLGAVELLLESAQLASSLGTANSLAPWALGPLVPWPFCPFDLLDPLVPWPFGPLGPLALWSLIYTIAFQKFGCHFDTCFFDESHISIQNMI